MVKNISHVCIQEVCRIGITERFLQHLHNFTSLKKTDGKRDISSPFANTLDATSGTPADALQTTEGILAGTVSHTQLDLTDTTLRRSSTPPSSTGTAASSGCAPGTAASSLSVQDHAANTGFMTGDLEWFRDEHDFVHASPFDVRREVSTPRSAGWCLVPRRPHSCPRNWWRSHQGMGELEAKSSLRILIEGMGCLSSVSRPSASRRTGHRRREAGKTCVLRPISMIRISEIRLQGLDLKKTMRPDSRTLCVLRFSFEGLDSKIKKSQIVFLEILIHTFIQILNTYYPLL